MNNRRYIRFFDEIAIKDVPIVGGKNASLGEMTQFFKQKEIRIPYGFATTAQAYFDFLKENGLTKKIEKELSKVNSKFSSLESASQAVQGWILKGNFSPELEKEILEAYRKLRTHYKTKNLSVAVRSSATAEDLPDASFAGQQETFLNISGEKLLLEACKKCYASLFTKRAITYRIEKKFSHMKVALSIGIQKMVRSDIGCSGVMFTIDTETGFKDLVVINGAFGLGENVVQGTIDPDEIQIFKPLLNSKYIPIIEKKLGKKEKKLIYSTSKTIQTKNISTPKKERESFVLSDEESLTLAKWGCLIEQHYKKPMDIEWAKDGKTKELFIVQARPETVQSQKKGNELKTFLLKKKSEKLATGLAIGEAIATGKAQVIKNIAQISTFKKGSILVTQMTTPDWVPIMKQAAGIITDHGGRTSHAAIMSRELNLPAIVGTNNGTQVIKSGDDVTLSCAEGEEGYVYKGILPFEETEIDLESLPKLSTDIMLNIASPQAAMRFHRLPCKGIGLARMEFIINNIIKIHPMALLYPEKVESEKTRRLIESITKGYSEKGEYFVDLLSKGIARIAASAYPHPVIVRMSDFKTNEYANLIGGKNFEPKEENPMLGFRGASRYYNKRYKEGFELECKALLRARETLGLTNIVAMIPFCRTLEEADLVLKTMEEFGLKRGVNGLKIYVMAEIPSNIILAKEFAERFDGFSIGSNDLTQLVLGIDRDSEELSSLFDERNMAVKIMIRSLIETAHQSKSKVGICGQAPSDYPDFAQFLIDCKIDSISLNPDSVAHLIAILGKKQTP